MVLISYGSAVEGYRLFSIDVVDDTNTADDDYFGYLFCSSVKNFFFF
jgi:hypothetical protein